MTIANNNNNPIILLLLVVVVLVCLCMRFPFLSFVVLGLFILFFFLDVIIIFTLEFPF